MESDDRDMGPRHARQAGWRPEDADLETLTRHRDVVIEFYERVKRWPTPTEMRVALSQTGGKGGR